MNTIILYVPPGALFSNFASKQASGNASDVSFVYFIGSAEDASRELDNQDLQKLWEDIFKKLEQTFDKKIMDVWYSYNGLNGYEKMKNKEIAKKYKVVPSNISYYLNKVNNFIRTDKKLYSMISDVYELMRECLHDRDEESDEMIPVVEAYHSSMFDDDEDML